MRRVSCLVDVFFPHPHGFPLGSYLLDHCVCTTCGTIADALATAKKILTHIYLHPAKDAPVSYGSVIKACIVSHLDRKQRATISDKSPMSLIVKALCQQRVEDDQTRIDVAKLYEQVERELDVRVPLYTGKPRPEKHKKDSDRHPTSEAPSLSASAGSAASSSASSASSSSSSRASAPFASPSPASAPAASSSSASSSSFSVDEDDSDDDAEHFTAERLNSMIFELLVAAEGCSTWDEQQQIIHDVCAAVNELVIVKREHEVQQVRQRAALHFYNRLALETGGKVKVVHIDAKANWHVRNISLDCHWGSLCLVASP